MALRLPGVKRSGGAVPTVLGVLRRATGKVRTIHTGTARRCEGTTLPVTPYAGAAVSRSNRRRVPGRAA